ncbi:MAG: hypothetical protein JSU86_01630 [Phycisphaerales bacterium]|nr:MAG: hypothetical protein JSU86_01630 [Phycisphaerales bacterium]
MTEKTASPLVGVLLGTAPTPERAALIADTYRSCPYCTSYTSAGRTTIGIFSLPVRRRWWLEWVTDEPEGLLGLERAEVFFAETVTAVSSWARGEVKPSSEQAPCGANCRECPKYGHECEGCPATQHYGRYSVEH